MAIVKGTSLYDNFPNNRRISISQRTLGESYSDSMEKEKNIITEPETQKIEIKPISQQTTIKRPEEAKHWYYTPAQLEEQKQARLSEWGRMEQATPIEKTRPIPIEEQRAIEQTKTGLYQMAQIQEEKDTTQTLSGITIEDIKGEKDYQRATMGLPTIGLPATGDEQENGLIDDTETFGKVGDEEFTYDYKSFPTFDYDLFIQDASEIT